MSFIEIGNRLVNVRHIRKLRHIGTRRRKAWTTTF